MNVGNWSVEVDAISPANLREIAGDCIYRHIDPIAMRRAQTIEQAERDSLGLVIEYLPQIRTLHGLG
jgi:hypothetical protein